MANVRTTVNPVGDDQTRNLCYVAIGKSNTEFCNIQDNMNPALGLQTPSEEIKEHGLTQRARQLGVRQGLQAHRGEVEGDLLEAKGAAEPETTESSFLSHYLDHQCQHDSKTFSRSRY